MATTTKQNFFDAFETSVSDNEVQSLLNLLESCVSELRDRIGDDETVENLLHPDRSPYILRSDMSKTNQDPEPLTQETIIEPLLEELGYEDLITEVSGASSRRDLVADYSYRIGESQIDSDQLLIEAEPMNKPLEGRGHGVDQVESWLSQREFHTDFGFATDGLRWVFIRYDPDSYSHNRIADVNLDTVFLHLFYNLVGQREDPVETLSAEQLGLVKDFIQCFSRENFTAIALEAHDVIRSVQEEISDEFYREYIRIVFGVRAKSDDRSPRSLVGDGVVSPDEVTGEDTRLFAVKLMNRLIFVKFLEDKHLVQHDLLSNLSDIYGDGAGHARSFYKSFIEPLFFEVMNKQPSTRSKHVQNIDEFTEIPYLNGGLFRPSLGEQGIDERRFDVENSVLKEVIDLLEKYEFSTEGGPTDLDPSVLGNVFEKTINYLTTDPGDKNKELGAFFTPKEITRFSAERTVRPALLERFEQHLIEERGWVETEVQYDTVYGLVDDLPEKTSLVTELLSEVVDELRVVDPAMGSGHFLTSVLEEIVTIRAAMYRKIGWDTSDHRLKKETVQNNIYGVDIVGPAVEIGKLRLWLSVIGEVGREEIEELGEDELALPNIAFNLRQGNSLIGYTGFPEFDSEGNGTLHRFQEDSVRRRYENIIEQIQLYEEKGWEAKPAEAEEHRKKALDLIEDARAGLISDLHREFKRVGLDISQEKVASFDPFHWVLEFAEVYADGGFDVIVGNPPWDRIKPLRDDYFSRFEAGFRTMMPDVKDATQERLLEDDSIAEGWEEYQRDIEIKAEYFKDGYDLQKPEVDGRVKPNPNDLSALFFERVFKLGRDDSHIAQVLPGVIWTGAMAKDLRLNILNNATMNHLAIFENRGIFENIDIRYKFGVVVFRNSGSTDEFLTKYQQGNISVLNEFEKEAISVSRRVLEDYSPEARIFPYIESERKLKVLEKLIQSPPLGLQDGSGWYMEPYQGLRRTNDSDRFVDESEGEYPVYGGKNIYQYCYTPDFFGDIESPEFWSVEESTDPDRSAKQRMREKLVNDLKTAIYDEFNGSGSQKKFVNDLLREHRGEPLSEDDVLLDSTEYRIGLRRITNATNERTLISSVIPKGIVCHNTLLTIRNYRIQPYQEGLSEKPLHCFYERVFTDEELFLIVGLLNSMPFDYLLRTKIDTQIVTYKFKESQMPDLSPRDEFYEYIWQRAAQLNCYGEEFEDMRKRLGGIKPATSEAERRELQAEIDAASIHAYGLDEDEMKFMLEDFHKVENPRVMDDGYFNLVREKYYELAS